MKKTGVEDNLIVKLTFEFAVRIIKHTELMESNRQYIMARQLFRSGTSIGANVNEAQSAESMADFIHKLKIADKETHETMYWIQLCNSVESYPKSESLIQELLVIKKVLGKIISSSRAKS